MKALKGKTRVLWWVAFVAVIAAIAIYRIGFHKPVPGFDKEVTQSIEDRDSQVVPTPPKEDPPVTPPESASQPPQTADVKLEQLQDRPCRSEKPLYFRVVFGEEGDHLTLGVLDESGGTGAGYDIAYVDENRNIDLTDDPSKKFAKYERGSRAGQIDPTFNFIGPLKDRVGVRYSLNIYSLRQNARAGSGHFFWTLDVDGWNYFFINGKMRLSSSAADALIGPPVRLAGPCKWEITARIRNGNPMISAGLKDENGCTLRIVRKGGRTLSPKLTLIQNGQVKAEKTMTFG
ncbi:MAG: hypothetical protein JXM79_22760 [Sedimentisphaerales bacterium]|nr:hypothetical protein [Sedimentisphaerales bacterium]